MVLSHTTIWYEYTLSEVLLFEIIRNLKIDHDKWKEFILIGRNEK